MADSVVTFLLQNLSRLLVEEVKLLWGVEDKIMSLRNELRFIDIFLKSSEGKRNNEVVKEVVSQIRDVAHKAEDVVDTYVANVAIRKSRNKLEKLFHGKDHLMMLHDVSAEIEKIRSSIDEIYKNKDRYGIGEGEFKSGGDAELLRKIRRDVEEEDVVGLVHDSSVVIKQLMEEDSRRNVVSIIGMGGLGKTTLARKIYNNDRVKEVFPCHAWGYVSNDYRARELLLSLLKCLLPTPEYNDLFKKKEDEGEEDAMGEEKLKKKVRECLKGKKYLVVLDDIWKTEVWDEVQDSFPDDHHSGSRILITSRIKEVAYYTGPTPPYDLPFLNNKESWELFSKKVFRGEGCPSDLEPLGRSIVESCGGLPLAIVVLAGLVSKKEKSPREWRRIKENVNLRLAQDKIVMNILKLSYDSLPPILKPCFLYFGIYPEDFEIPVRELIQLWMAERFIQSPQETGIPNPQEPEDAADQYLDELVDRSLVQVASRRSDGGVKTCRIHDLLRDLCISESKADKFFEVCTESNVYTLSNPRRLSLHSRTDLYMSSTKCNQSCTRSLFFFDQAYSANHMMKWIVKSFKLARVLSFGVGPTDFHSLPSDMKTLIHLRYLRIESEKIKAIPAFISNLWNLEMLVISGGRRMTVSSDVWNLKRLRHLLMRGSPGPVRLTEGSGSYTKTMPNLQTLSYVTIDPQLASVMDKGSFPKLRKLSLWYDSCAHEQLPSLHHLSNLKTLKIAHIPQLPLDANVFPSDLTTITLKMYGYFNPDNMNTLGRLSNLQILKLSYEDRESNGSSLSCAAGEFPQLLVFQMVAMNVKFWRLDKGAMPRLRRLVIRHCPYLTELPEELWSLNTLGEVQVSGPTTELANSLQNVELKNGRKPIIN